MLARILPQEPKIDFVRARFFAFALTGLLALAGIVSLATKGLHFGIDFRGGILIEAAAKDGKPIDFGALRTAIGRLGIGDAQIQQSGPPSQVSIRVANPSGDEAAGQAAVRKIQETLGADKYEFRRVEYVGPKVSSGLFLDGMIATALALLAIAIYVGVRFEWQFGVAALVATGHDVFIALAVYSMVGFEFDLVAVAALLTLAGYSINDTIVVFDRLRENMRKYKRTDFKFLINVSTNQMVVRTMLTSLTTALAVLPMLLFGGEALFNFTVTILVGILVGTYSSVYVASSLLIYLPAIRQRDDKEKADAAKPGKGGLATR
jgi:preprotein translocase SecF subunit